MVFYMDLRRALYIQAPLYPPDKRAVQFIQTPLANACFAQILYQSASKIRGCYLSSLGLFCSEAWQCINSTTGSHRRALGG